MNRNGVCRASLVALKLAAAVVPMALLGVQVRAQSVNGSVNLFTDSFNLSRNDDPYIWDINAELGTPRQSGTYVPATGVTWSEYQPAAPNFTQVNNGGQPGTMLLASVTDTNPFFPERYLRVKPNADFSDIPAGTKDLTIATTLYPASNVGFMVFAFGTQFPLVNVVPNQNVPGSGTFVNQTYGIALLMTPGGGWQTFNGPGGNVGGDNVTSLDNSGHTNNKYSVAFVMHNPVFDGVTPVAVSLYVNGVQVDANGSADGMDLSRTFTNNEVLVGNQGTTNGQLSVSYFGPLALTAGTYTSVFTSAASGSWNDGTNWADGAAPNGARTAASLASTGSNLAISLDSDVTVGSLAANSAGYTVSGPGSLHINNSTSTATVTVAGGSVAINTPVVIESKTKVSIPAGATLSVASLSGGGLVSLSGGGTLKLAGTTGDGGVYSGGLPSVAADGSLIDLVKGAAVLTGTTESAVVSLVKQWLSGQGGLGSSAAVAGTTTLAVIGNDEGLIDHGTANGVPYYTSFAGVNDLTASDVLVRYTYAGDVNLDGTVDGKDFRIAMESAIFGGSGWAQGDVDYSGSVDGNDLALIAANLGGPVIGLPVSESGGVSAIPEPASVSMLSMGGLVLARRRRA
jgi:hypothetical protein